MSRRAVSAGLLMYRRTPTGPQVLLVHPGGPFFRNRDEGAWSIPKGLVDPGEDLLTAAQREFREETGVTPRPPFLPLPAVRLPSGKVVHAWAFEGDCDPREIASNTFEIEWPPRSGRRMTFPEIDRADFFDLAAARPKIHPSQRPLLDSLEDLLNH